MKKDIILAGVGGQGILSIAATIGTAAINNNLNLKQAEVHGMSQRGGDVQSNLRLSDKAIYSDLIPEGKADMVISVEPMEALRYLSMLSQDGWLITNDVAFNNIVDYPEMDEVVKEVKKVKNHIIINAEQIAKDLGNVRAANIVVLGAATPFLDMDFDFFETAIKQIFGKKGDKIVELNISALRAGRDFALENK
ncbi:MAG: indolepyruvate oxidoreductase subunit beta [Bacteroidota bacterium]|nr:indolepyruvate oxidoreductase subunit beta [Bacteroidota bacterium]